MTRHWRDTVKPCDSCKRRPRIHGERFCQSCRSWKLREMEKDGYLQPVEATSHKNTHGLTSRDGYEEKK